MPTQRSLQLREQGELVQAVDTARAAGDPFKLLAAFRTEFDARLADLIAKDALTFNTEGARAAASAALRAAFDTLKVRLRDGYNFIKALASFEISDADRIGLFTTYGWEQGEIGDMTDLRAEALANQAITATPGITNPAWRYSAGLITQITTLLATINTNQTTATGGVSQAATTARNLAMDTFDAALGRVRFFYCFASDDRDQTDELARIGFMARRDAGEAQEQPLPEVPVGATFNAATNQISVAAMPAHASSLHAMRQVLGGVAELCGTGGPGNLSVSVVQLGPLTAGAQYEFWLVGFNSRGPGPESNHVTHVATLNQ